MKPITRFVERVSLRVLPAPQRNVLLHKMARESFYHFMRSRLGDFVVEVDPGPAGDPDIIMRTAVLTQAEAATKLDADHYLAPVMGCCSPGSNTWTGTVSTCARPELSWSWVAARRA